MTGPAHAGLHEVNRRECDGVVDERFNHAPTLVAVMSRAYWTLVHGGPRGSTGRVARQAWDVGPIGRRLRRDYSDLYEAEKRLLRALGTRPFLPRRTLVQGARRCVKLVVPVLFCRSVSRA
jgi:hypothetical protein